MKKLAVRPGPLVVLGCAACLPMGFCDLANAQQESAVVRVTPLSSGVKKVSLRGMAVRGGQVAWATGSKGTVLRTRDGGRTWQRVAVPGAKNLDFRDVELLADGSVLLMSAGPGDKSRLFRSADDGKTWRTVLVNAAPDGFFDGLAMHADGRFGMLYGDPRGGRLDLYVTRDGGRTWQAAPPDQRPEVLQGEYGFAASGTGIAMRDRTICIATGGSAARVLRSADRGRTWTAHATPVRSGRPSAGIFSLDFAGPQTLVAIGGDYQRPGEDRNNVATSADRGRSWMKAPGARMPHKACVRSLGRARLLTCGRTGVAFSSDRGRTWTRVSATGYYTLAFDPSSQTGFLAGSDGRVAKFEVRSSARPR